MKTPKELRKDIHALRTSVEAIINTLQEKAGKAEQPTWGIGKDCNKAAESLRSILKNNIIPEHYKVAVVGRFKAGKSAFVNELLQAKLAGENTSPETAAITSFSYGDKVKAVIKFVDQESWQKLINLYQEDPSHIDAHRLKMWQSFEGKERRNSDGELIEKFDLSALEKVHVKPGGHSIEIELDKQGDPKSENNFRRKIKEYTTGSRPQHCLVESIEISAPSKLLNQGVLLIDTPGLDDTERFRVALTEKAVEDVDAVLFLTQSGAAYGQSEKDFMLTLLRRGTVKQLIFVITQVDKTYEQHLKNAEFDDEEPESLLKRIEREELRIRNEIKLTLDELGTEDSSAMRHYREQLGVIGLAFTSAQKHRDWKKGEKVRHPIYADDPGGIENMQRQLLELLSTESRLSLIARNIASGTKSALDDLLGITENRLTAISSIQDGEEAERRLQNFRQEFNTVWAQFQSAATSEVVLLRKTLEVAKEKNINIIETIGLLAERELAEFETLDVGKHWRTKRSGNWGYMVGLQRRVANRIFPRVQQMLSDMTSEFAVFVEHFEKHLKSLSYQSNKLSDKLDLGASVPLDLTKTLTQSLDKSIDTANDLVTSEEQSIISFLDNFVTDEVADKISDVRDKVTGIWGRGTTATQTIEVRRFYLEIKTLLRDALEEHINHRCDSFGGFLALTANEVPEKAQSEVLAALANAEQDIKAAATARIGGQREKFEEDCNDIRTAAEHVFSNCEPFIDTFIESQHSAVIKEETKKVDNSSNLIWRDKSEGDSWIDNICNAATVTVERYSLDDGSTGWPFSRIFSTNLLTGSLRIALVDPYLAVPHQFRNLKEFLLLAAETSKPKEIVVITSDKWEERKSVNGQSIKDITHDIFHDFGTTLKIKIDPLIHDRYVVCDHGVLFKLGRGLDIYKPATGLASHRPSNRKVRRTEIDVFANNEWIVSKETE